MVIFPNVPIPAMPKLTITKYRNFSASNNKIRLTDYRFVIFVISYACIPKQLPKQNLYLGTFAFIGCHIFMPLLFRQVVHSKRYMPYYTKYKDTQIIGKDGGFFDKCKNDL